jgi:hypothetical protein
MKYLIISIILFLTIISTLQAEAFQDSKTTANADFEKINPVEAMAIANEWKWTRKDVKSFVNAYEVVFEFTDGTRQVIPLPQDWMLVAVAPYIRKTHK